jgi:hypothetical protein
MKPLLRLPEGITGKLSGLTMSIKTEGDRRMMWVLVLAPSRRASRSSPVIYSQSNTPPYALKVTILLEL